MPAYPVHPKAAAFRLMHDYEFDALVEGIRANGLLVPITLAKWVDKDTNNIVEGIIDGRNREEACEEAQVKPKYQNFRGSGKDGVATEEEIAAFIEQTHNRKNLTLDQLAMAKAILYPEGGRGLHKTDPIKDVKLTSIEQKGDGDYQRIQRARYVQKYRSDRVQGVVAGTEDPLYKIAQEIRNEQKKERLRLAAIAELRKAAPDLARDIDEQTLDLKAAQKELEKRKEEKVALKAFRKQSPELAELVDNGELTLDEAEEELAKQEREKAEQEKYEEDLAELRESDAELAKAVDDGELSLDDAIEQYNDAIEAAENLKQRLMSIYSDLAEAVKNGEMTIEAAEKESKERTTEAYRNKPPDMSYISKDWLPEAYGSLSKVMEIRKQIEQYQQHLDQLMVEEIDVIMNQALLIHEEWLKVVNLLRGKTDQKRHLDVIEGGEK